MEKVVRNHKKKKKKSRRTKKLGPTKKEHRNEKT